MKIKVSNGNAKIGEDTIIINMNSATDCPSRQSGLCQLDNPGKCYALKAERQYKDHFLKSGKFVTGCLTARRYQEQVWDNSTPDDIAFQLNHLVARGYRQLLDESYSKIKYIRFSESGDFKSQEDVNKMSQIADMVTVPVYGYTARRDLDFTQISNNMIVCGSGFKASNEFKAVSKLTPGNLHCVGNCRLCNLCKISHGKTVEVLLH